MIAPITDSDLVREVLSEYPVFDGHNDLPITARGRYGYDPVAAGIADGNTALHTDIPSLRAGGVGAQFWSVYVPSHLPEPEAVCQVLEQIDFVYRLERLYPEAFQVARTAADVRAAWASGRIASLMGAEGGHSIRESLGVLRMLRRLGVGYMTLTHNDNTTWAKSATGEDADYGLTDFGREVVREMNRIGMLVDISHVHEDTMYDAIATSSKPVMFSHSSCRDVANHPRNAPDGVLEALAANDGVIMITFVPFFTTEASGEHWNASQAKREELGLGHPLELEEAEPSAETAAYAAWLAENPAPTVGIDDVVRHIEHARDVAGIDHIGIGSDFDGIPSAPLGLQRVSDYPRLFEALSAKGWSATDLKKLASGNILRVLEASEVTSW